MSGILVQTVGQCKMQIWRYPENFNQTTDVFRFHLSKLGSGFAQLLSRSSIMTVGTSSTRGIACRTVHRPIPSDISVRGCTMSFSESRRAELVPPSPTNRLPTNSRDPYNCDGDFTSTSQNRIQQNLFRLRYTIAPTEI
jgi:hypothetical protein